MFRGKFLSGIFGRRRARDEYERRIRDLQYALAGYQESFRGMAVQAEATRVEIEQLRAELAKRDAAALPGQLLVDGEPVDVVDERDGRVTFEGPPPFQNDSEAPSCVPEDGHEDDYFESVDDHGVPWTE